MKDPVALTRAGVTLALKDAAAPFNISVTKFFRRRRLPIFEDHGDRHWIPTQSAVLTSYDIKETLTSGEFVRWISLSSEILVKREFQKCFANQITLFRALERYAKSQENFRNYADIHLQRSNGHLWLLRSQSAEVEDADAALQIFGLTEMVHVVRHVAGTAWCPSKILLRPARFNLFSETAELCDAEVIRSERYYGIAIPDYLAASRPRQAVLKSDATLSEAHDAARPTSLSDCVEALISTMLVDGYPTVGIVAESVGMSMRTMQRRLHDEGVSYSEMVDHVRFELAKTRLGAPESRLTDIAAELGYDGQNSLTRAFHRWAGMSPTAYRATLRHN